MVAQRESTIEKNFVSKMDQYGVTTIKMQNLDKRGWPDRLVVLPNGRTLWIEFKRPGGEVTRLQQHRHDILRELGHEVAVCRTARQARDMVLDRIIGVGVVVDA